MQIFQQIIATLTAIVMTLSAQVGNLAPQTQLAQVGGGTVVAVDTQAQSWSGSGNTNMQVAITLASNSNRALILFVGAGNQTNGIVSSVSGAGASWSRCVSGGSSNGKGTYHGDCYVGVAPSTGAQTVTINFAGTTNQNMAAVVYSVYNVDQTNPTSGYGVATAGNLAVATVLGDIALSTHFDLTDTRAISGCTTTRDISTYGGVGVDSARCTGSSAVTFTWGGWGTNSIGLGVNVKQAGGGGAPSDTISPSIPGGLSATTISSTQINLSWSASTDNVGVTGYDIYRNGTLLTSTVTNSYNDTGLSPSTSYSYTVRSKDAALNTSSQSSSVSATTQAPPPPPPTDTTAPSVPTNLSASAVSSSQINLSWSASTDAVGVTGYDIYRGGTLLTTVTGTSYSNTGLSASTQYSYTVRAKDAAGNNSSQSSSVSATTQASTPPPPTGNTVTAASCSQADVQSAINSVSVGGTVNVPAGTCSWAGNISISGISLVGPGQDASSPTIITTGQVNATKHGTAYTVLRGFRFTGANQHFVINGNDTQALFISYDNYYYSNSSYLGAVDTNGALFAKDTFYNASESGGNYIHATLGATSAANSAWAAPHTMGSADTNGNKNTYFEDCTIRNFRDGFPDVDNGARVVIRNCTFIDSAAITHGGGSGGSGNDSSTYGARHLEIYNNVFDRVSNTQAMNQWVWYRGSSGVVANNIMENADSPDGSSYPGKPEVRMSVGCSAGAYPRQYQVGQSSQAPDSTPDNPILIFGNTGYGAQSIAVGENPNVACSNVGGYIQENRDYFKSNSWNWIPYTYPHPARAALTGTPPPPSDTTAPSTPTNLSATAISSSAINLTWTASTDASGVTGYKIYRNNIQIGTSATNSYSDTGLSPSTSYSYTVSAYDAVGNTSSQSSSASATTQSTAPTPLKGDLNLDHIVNSLDFSLLNSRWNQNYSPYDLLVDGIINSLDFAYLSSNWLLTW